MPANVIHLIGACLAMVLLTGVVALLMLIARTREMKRKRIHPQTASTSATMAAKLEDIQPADNFRNLFEVPVLFYLLAAIALATNHIPGWLVICAWLFVALRALHTLIHCTYNRVVHRFAAYAASFFLLIGMWIAYFVSVASIGA